MKMTRTSLYINCVGGVAGDMLLSALVETLGDSELIDHLPAMLGFDDASFDWVQARPGGFAALRLQISFDPEAHPKHRGLKDVEELIERSRLSESVRARARTVFQRLAEAEGKVHGQPADQVHFHEVGAVDAILDVLGCCVAIDALDPHEIVCSPLPMGQGMVTCAHGTLPLPAPAVAAMLGGVPVYDAGIEGETVTPTGAALVTVLADRFGGMPSMTVTRVGIGAGSRTYLGLPNLVRVFAGQISEADETSPRHCNLMVECTIDDMDPRLFPALLESLFSTANVLDAYITPVIMKKGRPAHLISVLTAEERVQAAIRVLLRETTTLGCRTYSVDKHTLDRRMETVTTPWGPVAVKVALAEGQPLRAVPEYEDCARLARENQVPVREVLAVATAAAERKRQEDASNSASGP
jgi:uncharacterized protein (TIGR00299 family) protein